jgi:hypothetical protein
MRPLETSQSRSVVFARSPPPTAGDEEAISSSSHAAVYYLLIRDTLQGESLSFDAQVSLRAERTQCEAGPKGRMNPHPGPQK